MIFPSESETFRLVTQLVRIPCSTLAYPWAPVHRRSSSIWLYAKQFSFGSNLSEAPPDHSPPRWRPPATSVSQPFPLPESAIRKRCATGSQPAYSNPFFWYTFWPVKITHGSQCERSADRSGIKGRTRQARQRYRSHRRLEFNWTP